MQQESEQQLAFLQDEMLPPSQMRELYEIAKAAGAKDLTWVDFEEAHHMVSPSKTTWSA